MAKTLQDLQTEVRTYLDEAVQEDWTDTQVTMAVNRAYHDVCAFVMEIYEQFYETTSPFTYAVVANQQEYLIDPSLIKVTRVEINYNPLVTGSQPSRVLSVKSDEILRNLANADNPPNNTFASGYYLHGSIGSQYIGFVPVPQVSDTTGQSISVWGIALPTDLVNSGDNVNIPYADRFSYLVSLKAAAQLLRKGQEEEAAAGNYINEYRAGIVDLMNFLKDRQADGGTFIEDDILDDIDFEVLTLM